MRTWFPLVLLAMALAVADCALFDGPVLLTTDAESYTRDPASGTAAVELTLHNGTSSAIGTEGCATTIPLGYRLDHRTSNGWQHRASNLVCAPPTFAGVTLQPGEQHSAVVYCCTGSGVYRVRVFYHLPGDYASWDSTSTAQFVVQ